MRRRLMMKRLPSEYQEVGWVAGDGNSYLDLFTIKDTASVKAIIEPLMNSTWDRTAFFGGGVYHDFLMQFELGYPQFAGYMSSNGGWDWTKAGSFGGSFHTITLQNGVLTFDEETVYTYTPSGRTTSNTAKLFGSYNNNLICGKVKIKEFSYDDSTNNIHLIPCYRKSDGVIGMYDLCGSICPLTNSPFYINAGTGTFGKGADVQ